MYTVHTDTSTLLNAVAHAVQTYSTEVNLQYSTTVVHTCTHTVHAY